MRSKLCLADPTSNTYVQHDLATVAIVSTDTKK